MKCSTKLTTSCPDCGITNDVIDKELFRCFPDSPSLVTYRARLQGTSETDSGSLISLIEEWVSNGADIGVTGLHMTVDTKCSVEVSSFSEEECLGIILASIPDATQSQNFIVDSTPGPNSGPTDSTTDSAGNTVSHGPIIGGIVAVLVILIIALSTTCIIIVVLILKYRRGDSKRSSEL